MGHRRLCFPAFASMAASVRSLLSGPTLAEPLRLTTPRGDRIDVLAEFPTGVTGPVPTVVLAPGANYPMHQPLMEATAGELLARGMAVWRFDWAYTRRQLVADFIEDHRK